MLAVITSSCSASWLCRPSSSLNTGFKYDSTKRRLDYANSWSIRVNKLSEREVTIDKYRTAMRLSFSPRVISSCTTTFGHHLTACTNKIWDMYFDYSNSNLSHQLGEVPIDECSRYTLTAGCTSPNKSISTTASLMGANKLAMAFFPILAASAAEVHTRLLQDSLK